MTVTGKNVSECVELVVGLSAEIESMENALDNLFSETLRKSEKYVLAGKVIYDSRLQAWLYTDSAYSFPLKRKGKGNKPVERYLGFQTSISDDGINIPGNVEPLIHIFCWEHSIRFDAGDYLGFPLDVDSASDIQIINERLMLWGGQDTGQSKQWNYSLRLLSMCSIKDLETYIVSPALALLDEKSVCEALPDKWLDQVLVRYPDSIRNGL